MRREEGYILFRYRGPEHVGYAVIVIFVIPCPALESGEAVAVSELDETPKLQFLVCYSIRHESFPFYV